MLKIRHIISLLVLILLFISCNLKSPQRGGMIRKEPDFRRIVTGEGALRKPSEVVTLTGVEDSVPALAEVEKSLGVKLNELLDTFKVSKEGKISIFKIKDVVTDASIDSDEGYKTYTDLDFYTLLNELGAGKVKDIIKFDLDVVKIQKAALDAINNVQNLQKKQNLQVLYNDRLDEYLLYLKGLFSKPSADNVLADDVHFWFTNDDYDNGFTEIETEARRIIENGDVYAKLSYKEKLVIDEIREIVTNDKIGKGEDYKTYTIPDFNALLNELGSFKVLIIIRLSVDINYLKDGRLVARIDSIKDEILRKKFKTRYDDQLSKYQLNLKKVFSKSSADAVYANVISNEHINEFTEIETEVKRIVEGTI
ncbi:hypothetical protein BOFE_09330 (plasmid) [Candidatus Borrelia fainii]|uniref:Lipoprotein n=1 Tax=Candidatus Borrelia fainii TaxID=2518322 RepID=A0ABN6USP8_9SPIR|nr:hypothetical protein [Candidatus Borrelia fainii]BDU63393.1 hypothetical protein BOFE_09330 [Candidatus Borrelia fainii]